MQRGENIGVWGEGGKIIGDPSLCNTGQAQILMLNAYVYKSTYDNFKSLFATTKH
jgi:hypothetical protein